MRGISPKRHIRHHGREEKTHRGEIWKNQPYFLAGYFLPFPSGIGKTAFQELKCVSEHSFLQGQVAPSAPVPIPRRTQGRARAGLSSRGTLKRLFLPCIGRRLLLTGWRKGGNGGHPAEGQRPRMREEGRREKSLAGHRRPEKREGKEGTSCPSTATGGHKGTDSRMGRMREEGQEEISTVGGLHRGGQSEPHQETFAGKIFS